MKGLVKDISDILSVIAMAPSECSDCVAFCTEGRITCECRGDFHPQTCEYSSCYKSEGEE